MSISMGLDIAKEKIDCYCDGVHSQIANNAKAIKGHFSAISRECQILMEATGVYHRTAHRVLEQMGFGVMVINPYQSKHFAKALNLICKTDKVDAKLLWLYAEKMDFKVTVCAEQEEETLQDMSRHLSDLKEVEHSFTMRLREATGVVKKSLTKLLGATQREILMIEKSLLTLIEADESLSKKCDCLTSIPGVGEVTAVFLLSSLRELGRVNKREIAALSGLAPMNNDSGQFKGKRRMRGGRREIRAHLYMPILGAATQHNPRLKAFYQRLVASGKPKKVALGACMRKLIVWANTLLATEACWDENYAESG